VIIRQRVSLSKEEVSSMIAVVNMSIFAGCASERVGFGTSANWTVDGGTVI